jgi:hypothetical protein
MKNGAKQDAIVATIKNFIFLRMNPSDSTPQDIFFIRGGRHAYSDAINSSDIFFIGTQARLPYPDMPV